MLGAKFHGFEKVHYFIQRTITRLWDQGKIAHFPCPFPFPIPAMHPISGLV
jgi:hypothetical protein